MMENSIDQKIDNIEVNAPDKLEKIYFNGFSVTVTLPDFKIVLLNDDVPIGYLETTHIVAKTLSTKISQLITRFESDSGMNIKTIDEIDNSVKEKQDQKE